MRAFVFTDKALERYAGRFVWLSVDTQNSKNADFLKKYPINVWPTMLVVDPSKERVVLRYAGGATVGQLSKLLDQAQSKTKSPADDALERADRLANEGKNPEAAKEYERALDTAPKGWKPLGRAAEGLMMALTMAQQSEPCATRANELYPRLRGTLSGADVAAEHKERAALLATLEKATRASLDDKTIDMSGDDRSGLYESLVSARKAEKDEEGAKKVAEQWAAFLEGEAKKAKTAEQRAVYDSHRIKAYLDLGTPGKIGILRGRADTLLMKGDKEAAKQTMRDAIAYAKSLPSGQVSERMITALEKRLEIGRASCRERV